MPHVEERTAHMTNEQETAPVAQCPQCQQLFRDDDALRQHGLRAHFQTREENEQQHADAVMHQAQQTTADRQQDGAGRRETAGQPSDPEEPTPEQHEAQQQAARQEDAHAGDAHQRTQQQQRQVG
jgi:uncharacterized C2H2 Zn-finger protein